MAGKLVRFHPEADREYLSSLTWDAERSVAAALLFEGEFQRTIRAIAEAPERWPAYLSGCRRYVLQQFPFSVVHRVRDEDALVLAVAHAHRRPVIGKSGLVNSAPTFRPIAAHDATPQIVFGVASPRGRWSALRSAKTANQQKSVTRNSER